MIYIIGDIHADFLRSEEDKFWTQSNMTKNYYVIICRDFGSSISHDMRDGILKVDEHEKYMSIGR